MNFRESESCRSCCIVTMGPSSPVKRRTSGPAAAGLRSTFREPGRPTDNAYVESFNGTFRAECLDADWFATLSEPKHVIEAWRGEYNECRPHRALGERTPREFANEFTACRKLIGNQTAEDSSCA
jgi:transposase InsO family protein